MVLGCLYCVGPPCLEFSGHGVTIVSTVNKQARQYLTDKPAELTVESLRLFSAGGPGGYFIAVDDGNFMIYRRNRHG